MAKNVSYSSAALDESTSAAPIPAVKVFLRDQDDAGNDLTGTDRFYIAVDVQVDGDDGSTRRQSVVRQLASVPVGIISNADKLELIRICKLAYNAARAVATND